MADQVDPELMRVSAEANPPNYPGRGGVNNSKRILCVEDDKDSLEMMRTLLEYWGYEVITAGTVTEGLLSAKASGLALIIVDGLLKDGTGIGMCHQIRTFNSQTPILFHSGLNGEPSPEQAMEAGAQGYLVKPSGIGRLGRMISRLIDGGGGEGQKVSPDNQ